MQFICFSKNLTKKKKKKNKKKLRNLEELEKSYMGMYTTCRRIDLIDQNIMFYEKCRFDDISTYLYVGFLKVMIQGIIL